MNNKIVMARVGIRRAPRLRHHRATGRHQQRSRHRGNEYEWTSGLNVRQNNIVRRVPHHGAVVACISVAKASRHLLRAASSVNAQLVDIFLRASRKSGLRMHEHIILASLCRRGRWHRAARRASRAKDLVGDIRHSYTSTT